MAFKDVFRSDDEIARLEAEVARLKAIIENPTLLQWVAEWLTRELAEVERFRAAPLATIRKLLGDKESPDEAIAGSVCAILLTRDETVRRKKNAERERDALRACVTQLAGALWGLRSVVCWCPCGPTELGQHDQACELARAALAAVEKLVAS